MNDKELTNILKEAGAAWRSLDPRPDCPGDDVLLDYVYEELSETERMEVARHKESCERCRFEILKIEADRTAFETALEEDPDALMAQALGPSGVKEVREAVASPERSATTTTTTSSLWKAFLSRVEEGWEGFQAALASVSMKELLFDLLSPMLVTRGAGGGVEEEAVSGNVQFLGEAPSVYPVFVSRNDRYQTLLILGLQRKEIRLLYGNRGVTRPLQVSPPFSARDMGLNRICLIIGQGPLSIDRDEVTVLPDRFIEIVAMAADEGARVILFDVEVKARE